MKDFSESSFAFIHVDGCRSDCESFAVFHFQNICRSIIERSSLWATSRPIVGEALYRGASTMCRREI